MPAMRGKKRGGGRPGSAEAATSMQGLSTPSQVLPLVQATFLHLGEFRKPSGLKAAQVEESCSRGTSLNVGEDRKGKVALAILG